MNYRFPFILFWVACAAILALRSDTLIQAAEAPSAAGPKPLHTYTLTKNGTPASYDEAIAVASIQGIINRTAPDLYILSGTATRPQYWLDLLSKEGRWLQGRQQAVHTDLHGLIQLGGDRIKGVVIWDDAVPATINVATTAAGVLDAVVLSPEMAAQHLPDWNLPVLKDFLGLFTGAETGSKKNDAYRWAIREYLAKGLCSSRLVCLFEDSFNSRATGDIGYGITRDWAVKNRSFVYDLSPWGDEKPGDDPDQRLGLDLETYLIMLTEIERQSAGKHMTEISGFFDFDKYSNVPGHASKHDPVPTEWESVWLMSPFNCYQNTITSHCYNQSLHSQAPRQPLSQDRVAKPLTIENKAYICVLMADYDSSTTIYDFLPNHWHDPARGEVPLAWGINPNLLDTYPDLIAYYYSTATPADTITADASAAGYMNPNRIKPEHLPMFVEHNQRYFREAAMSIAPMVLDWDQPTPAVKDAFQQFAPDGYGTIIMDLHYTGGVGVQPHVWKGMPVTELINEAGNFANPAEAAELMSTAISKRGSQQPGFHLFRIVWTNPTNIIATIDKLRQQRPDLDIEVLDPHTFFSAFKKHYGTP